LTVGITTDDELLARAEAIAGQLATSARNLETRAERRRRRQIAEVVADPASQTFLTDLTDQVIRIRHPRRAALRLRGLVRESGPPTFVTGLNRAGLLAAARLGPWLPGVVMPLVRRQLRREFAAVVLPAEPAALARHIRRRRAQGIRLNVNLLGEAIVGEQEAARRRTAVIGLIRRPEVEYVSVKISAICARLSVLGYDDSVDRLCGQLRPLYAAALAAGTLVTLDMESYEDLGLTIDAFERVLSEPVFSQLDAGIVLQAYLPDSVPALDKLATFARQRFERHGSTVRIRLVKGANLALERVEAELRGWPQAPFTTKVAVDAQYKRLLDRAIDPAHGGALRVGVASHNLFDVGWALALRETTGALIEIEMLEGMANAEALAASRAAGGLLLYAPVVAADDFASAVAYLVRRFDENTAPENFLAHLFDLSVGSPAWNDQRRAFRAAVQARHEPVPAIRRTQKRGGGAPVTTPEGFANEPDTDFTLPHNRAWCAAALDRFAAMTVPPVLAQVDGEAIATPLTGSGLDPSNPGAVLYRYVQADVPTLDRAVAAAQRAAPAWRARTARDRCDLLRAVADVMRRERDHTLATMAHDAGKTIGEGDTEVSEAIDFATYYGEQALALQRETSRSSFAPHGVVVVAPPWNFPYAIPASGVFAALSAGNTVLLKPAPETVLTASVLAHQCWEAGIPTDVLQFVPCGDDGCGRHLISHPGVDAVIFTGSWETARMFLGWRPGLELRGETSGKNALVITASADLDDAIADLVRSAFGHAGQKCSAASLAIVEAPVYDDDSFRQRLADAVASLRVGPADVLSNDMGPLIGPAHGPLLHALTHLDEGEEWLVRPSAVHGNPQLWTPGVKLGVRAGSAFHRTECFGPVLGVMRAHTLDHAIELQNSTGYGLTGGIHSLDSGELAHWCAGVEVGNAYVNRVITGAVVQRQPFGGWGRSVVGPSAKAGGPNYVASLGCWLGDDEATLTDQLEVALDVWKRGVAGVDPSGLRAESNVLRLRALDRVSLRLGTEVEPRSLALALAIAARLDVMVDLSSPTPLPGTDATVEGDATYVGRLSTLAVSRVRLPADAGVARLAALDAGFEVDTTPLSSSGRHEVLHWVREQTISATRHRHGNVHGDEVLLGSA
jgi:RHH-type transcriptional regulator, proline utilization regulon repressor / proline dehydrogenase / delta 1-pyrroline-5-carboxylate dehydrogenase